MLKPIFANNEVYHLYNRGVEKRTIFQDDKDRSRFIHDLFEFNDTAPAVKRQSSEVEPPMLRRPRKLLVELLAFCFMPNHFHLLVRQKIESGAVLFMKKLGTGYTMYFNQRYERVGSLFQGRFKAVHVDREEHLLHLLFYIHFNPLDIAAPGWRDGEIADQQKALDFLNNYRWSSHLDYAGKRNFPSLTSREWLLEIAGGVKSYTSSIKDWLKEMDLGAVQDLTIE